MSDQDEYVDPEAKVIMDRYPSLFAPVESGAIAYGFTCDRGWLPLLDRLFSDLDVIRQEDDLTDLKVIQVKEKFGGLRVYVRDGNVRVKERIWEAEDEAYATCETCGGSTPGTTRYPRLSHQCLCHVPEEEKAGLI